MSAEQLLADCVASTRVLGADVYLVLAGGGNTSVKCILDGKEVMYIKGSGRDMAHVSREDFPALSLSALLALRERKHLSDLAMLDSLRAAQIDTTAPAPSVESLVHAWLPYRFVDHSHSDTVLTVMASAESPQQAQDLCQKLFADAVEWLPFYASGFPLAQACAAAPTGLRGLLLKDHGIMAFGESAKECAANHAWMVSRAEQYLQQHQAPTWNCETQTRACPALDAATPFCWRSFSIDAQFLKLPDAHIRATSAALTPGHVLHVGPFPMWLDDDENLIGSIHSYRRDYQDWSQRYGSKCVKEDLMIPRTAIHGQSQTAFAAGFDFDHAELAAEIFRHNLEAKLRGSALGPWYGASQEVVFAAENSTLERAKFARSTEESCAMVDKGIDRSV
ncbi:MAG: class II aldolase/adducin family protein [Planctomycetota bacterium]